MKKQNLNCGSCIFLSRDRCFERRCEDQGKLPSSKSCVSHKPDVFALSGSAMKVRKLGVIANAIKGMTPNELQVLGSVLQAERNTRKFGWTFYQRVYIRFTGSSSSKYFSNFAVGYVVYADKEHVRIVGESGKMMLTAINEVDGNTIYTLDRFKVLAAEMTKAKHFVDPEFVGSRPKKPIVAQLDDVLDSDRQLPKRLTKSKAKTDDLVSLIAKMSTGEFITKKRKSSRRISGGPDELVMSWNNA